MITIALAPIGLAACSAPSDDDAVELQNTVPDHSLPQGAYAPHLQKWFLESGKTEPWSISGDFDGDSVDDWAGLLRNADGDLDLVVVHSPNGVPAHAILATPGADSDYVYFGVERQPPGTIHGFPPEDGDPAPVVTTSNSSIQLVFYEKSSVLYYWADGSFRELWTGD